MRIVAGEHRGRVLSTPKNQDIRPTSDKVRQAVFNILNSRGLVREAVILDAFCGTGALGLEALSQGASFCYFFDKARESMNLTRENVSMLSEDARCFIEHGDAAKIALKSETLAPASLVFMDPPYNQGLVDLVIPVLIDKGWVAQEAWFVIETSKQETIMCPLINIELEKTYGDTKITLASL